MKSYREIADSVFARREQYMIAQRKKKQAITRATVSVGSVALVSLAGIALLRNNALRDTPPVTDGGVTTTPAAPPGAETTTATTAPSVTTAGVSTDTTTVTDAPTQTAATSVTTRPSTSHTTKTEPSKTTTPTTAPKKQLIGASEPDNEFSNEAVWSKDRVYISSRLQKWMEMFAEDDVNFAVIVSIPPLNEDYNNAKLCNEELMQIQRKYDEVYRLFVEEAKQHNPSWDGIAVSQLSVWTDTMRANYEWWLSLIEARKELEDRYSGPYIQSLLDERFETMKRMCDTEPVAIQSYTLTDAGFTWHIYYAELSAETITFLAEQGGYAFTLAQLNQRDYGHWDIDE